MIEDTTYVGEAEFSGSSDGGEGSGTSTTCVCNCSCYCYCTCFCSCPLGMLESTAWGNWRSPWGNRGSQEMQPDLGSEAMYRVVATS